MLTKSSPQERLRFTPPIVSFHTSRRGLTCAAGVSGCGLDHIDRQRGRGGLTDATQAVATANAAAAPHTHTITSSALRQKAASLLASTTVVGWPW